MSDGMDGMGLSYTAVTPRASLQSDANNKDLRCQHLRYKMPACCFQFLQQPRKIQNSTTFASVLLDHLWGVVCPSGIHPTALQLQKWSCSEIIILIFLQWNQVLIIIFIFLQWNRALIIIFRNEQATPSHHYHCCHHHVHQNHQN